MWKDPIVEEIRKQRLKIESDCGNDFGNIFKMAMKIQEKITSGLVSKPALRRPTETTSEIR